jgi:hypothetical protein
MSVIICDAGARRTVRPDGLVVHLTGIEHFLIMPVGPQREACLKVGSLSMTARSGLCLAALTVVVIGVGVVGCGRMQPAPGSAAPTPTVSVSSATPSTTAAPTTATTKPPPTIDAAIILAADGIGPYRIGVTLTDLTGRSLVVGVTDSMTCPGVKIGNATGRYAGKLRLAFQSGQLLTVFSSSTEFRTPSGGKVGMKLTTLQSIYGSRGSVVPGYAGGGYLVKVAGSDHGVVFVLDPTETSAISIGVGDAKSLEEDVKSGEGC